RKHRDTKHASNKPLPVLRRSMDRERKSHTPYPMQTRKNGTVACISSEPVAGVEAGPLGAPDGERRCLADSAVHNGRRCSESSTNCARTAAPGGRRQRKRWKRRRSSGGSRHDEGQGKEAPCKSAPRESTVH